MFHYHRPFGKENQLLNEIIHFLDQNNFDQAKEHLILLLHTVLVVRNKVHSNLISENKPKKLLGAAKEIYKDIPFSENVFAEIYQILKDVTRENIIALLKQDDSFHYYSFHPQTDFLLHELEERIKSKNKKTLESIFIPDFFSLAADYITLIEKYPHLRFFTTCNDEHQNYILNTIYSPNLVQPIEYSSDNKTELIQQFFTNQKMDIVVCYCTQSSALERLNNALSGKPIEECLFEREFRTLDAFAGLMKPKGEMLLFMTEQYVTSIENISYNKETGESHSEKTVYWQLRKFLLNNFAVKEIHYFKRFRNEVGKNDYSCLLEREKYNSTRIKIFFKKDFSLPIEIEKEQIVPFEKMAQLENWRLESVLALKDEAILQFKQSDTKKYPLRDLYNCIFRGKSLLSSDDKNEEENKETLYVVNLKDITDYGEIGSNLETINLDREKNDRYLLQDGDVLVSIRGTVFKAAIYHNTGQMTIPSVNFLVIRPNQSKILGDYLMLFLTSEVGRKFIEPYRSRHIFNLKAADFEKMEIPVPPLSVQKSLVQKYQKGLEKYNHAVQQWKETLSKIYQDLY